MTTRQMSHFYNNNQKEKKIARHPIFLFFFFSFSGLAVPTYFNLP